MQRVNREHSQFITRTTGARGEGGFYQDFRTGEERLDYLRTGSTVVLKTLSLLNDVSCLVQDLASAILGRIVCMRFNYSINSNHAGDNSPLGTVSEENAMEVSSCFEACNLEYAHSCYRDYWIGNT